MTSWITQLVGTHGAFAVLVLMSVENVFPPLPSELIMPFAGFVAARGDAHWATMLTSAVCGSVLGALPWYWAGRRLGKDSLLRLAERHGRWLAVSPGEIERAQRWFDRHGALALVVGRMVPGVRTFVALPAGIAATPLVAFVLWTAIGSALWSGTLLAAGYVMEQNYDAIQGWIDPVSKGTLVVLLGAYLWRVARPRSRKTPG